MGDGGTNLHARIALANIPVAHADESRLIILCRLVELDA